MKIRNVAFYVGESLTTKTSKHGSPLLLIIVFFLCCWGAGYMISNEVVFTRTGSKAKEDALVEYYLTLGFIFVCASGCLYYGIKSFLTTYKRLLSLYE